MVIHTISKRNIYVLMIFTDTPSPRRQHGASTNPESLQPNFIFGDGINPSAIHIAIDWDPTALHLRYQSTRERVSKQL